MFEYIIVYVVPCIPCHGVCLRNHNVQLMLLVAIAACTYGSFEMRLANHSNIIQ